ncbi:MAG: GPW/gp25 family protein [Anaerolineales bacterium]|nr:GPW/gp25 family protein [Anaerolineales bacterium]
MSSLAFPYAIDSRGRTAVPPTTDAHLQQLIEQVLFTNPGERVNRPDFGAGVMQLMFAPDNDEMAAATEFLIRGALQQWLGDLIQVEAVQIRAEEANLHIVIQYVRRQDQQRQTVELTP